MNFDVRQRAMLLQMGVKVWQPDTVNAQHADESAAALHHVLPAVVQPVAAPAGVTLTSITTTGIHAHPANTWEALTTTIARCQACSLGQDAQLKTNCYGTLGWMDTTANLGKVPQKKWLLIGEAPSAEDVVDGCSFRSSNNPSGILLQNMLRAMQVDVESVAWIPAVKCRTEGASTGIMEIMACQTHLHKQIAWIQPDVILAMGRIAAQALLAQSTQQQAQPLQVWRGVVHSYKNIPVVVTHAPSSLLRHSTEKSKVWDDLCLALQALHVAGV